MKPTIDHVEAVVAKAANSPMFTSEEVQALKAMALAWRGLEAFGRVAGVVRKVLVYVGWMIAAYVAIKYVLGDWVKGLPK